MKQARLAPGDDHAIQITEYVCGLLSPQERAQIHVLLSRDDQALAHALAWEEELLALVDALPRETPSTVLRERLQRTLGIGPPPAFQPPPQPQLLRRPSRDPLAAPLPAPQAPSASPRPASGTTPRDAAGHQDHNSVRSATGSPAAEPRSSRATGAAPVAACQKSVKPRATSHTPETAVPPSKQTQHPPTAGPAAPHRSAPPAREDGEAPGRQRVLVRKLWFWRLMAVCAALAAIVGFMLPGEPPPPPVQIVKVAPTRAAILQAPGATSTPGWTATLGPEGDLMMQPLVHTEVPTGSQVLLWTRSERIPEPRLLGRINPNQPVQVTAAQLGSLADDQLLEITLETDEDAAKAVPNGPILFIGRMTVFGAEGAAGPTATDAAATASATSGPITR